MPITTIITPREEAVPHNAYVYHMKTSTYEEDKTTVIKEEIIKSPVAVFHCTLRHKKDCRRIGIFIYLQYSCRPHLFEVFK